MEKQTPITLKGIVIAAEWGKNGEVSAVEIAGYDERRYRVVDDLMGIRLRQIVHEKVIVDGTIEKRTNGIIIYVKGFRFDLSGSISDADKIDP